MRKYLREKVFRLLWHSRLKQFKVDRFLKCRIRTWRSCYFHKGSRTLHVMFDVIWEKDYWINHLKVKT